MKVVLDSRHGSHQEETRSCLTISNLVDARAFYQNMNFYKHPIVNHVVKGLSPCVNERGLTQGRVGRGIPKGRWRPTKICMSCFGTKDFGWQWLVKYFVLCRSRFLHDESSVSEFCFRFVYDHRIDIFIKKKRSEHRSNWRWYRNLFERQEQRS